MKVWEKIKSIDYRFYICLVITACFVIVSVLFFPSAFIRICESFVDLWNSIKYYFCSLFGIDTNIDITVINFSSIPFTPFLNLPATWEEFTLAWSNYWNTFFTLNNLQAYFNFIGNALLSFSKILLLVGMPAVLLLYVYFRRYMTVQNNDYNKDTKPLKCYKKFLSSVVMPIKNWSLTFWQYLKNSHFITIWLVIFAFNFNIFSIIIEFIAFYLYFVLSFDISNIYIQIYKLFCDLSVMFATVPLPIWLLIICVIVYKMCRKIGYARLHHFERRNCGFINERPIVLMVCGTMGKKKTTVITDMSLSQECMFRDKAFEKLLLNDLKFPNFPWVNLENTLKQAIDRHLIYNLATCRKFIQHIEYFWSIQTQDIAVKKSCLRHLKKLFGYNFKNFIFDYEFTLYGVWYDDKLKMTNIWDVLETYSQLYFIYIVQSSLILSNYSIRVDNLIDDIGNFPIWNEDFFKRDSRLIDSFSRHSHILDFDSLRLGKKLIADNVNKDSFEFGVVNITEIGKERKNNLELKELKKNEDITNQKNDGFNDWLKMVRHSATVDYFPFVKVITDEQRPESWGADARDLLDIVHIESTGDERLAMPLFSLFELVYGFVIDKFQNLYVKYRYNRGDNSLPIYLIKQIANFFFKHYTNIYNTFGYYVLNLQVEKGTQDSSVDNKKYYLMNKKIYSKRFSTDCFSDYFNLKSLRSSVGIGDLPEYITEKASFDELKMQNSYFVSELNEKNKKE